MLAALSPFWVTGPSTPTQTEAPLPADPLVSSPGERSSPLPEGRQQEVRPGPRTHGRLVAEVFEVGTTNHVPDLVLIAESGERVEGSQDGELETWLAPGSQTVTVIAPGYQSAEFTVKIERGTELRMVYRLEPDLDGPRYYTLVESKREVAVSRTTLQDDEIHTVAGSRGDPFAVVKSLPGTAQVAGFLPYVVVRGAAPGNTGYYLDGVRVPLLFHVAIGPSVVHPYFIEAVDFYPGGAPVRLGRYTNGIIEGRTHAAQRDRVRGEVDLRVTDAGMMLDLPFDRRVVSDCTESRRRDCEKGPALGSVTLAGRYSYTGGLLSLIPALNVSLQFWDYQARVDHRLGKRARYRAFAYGAFDSIGPKEEITFDDEGEPVTNTDPDPFLLFLFHRFDQRIEHRMRAGTLATYGLALGLDQSGTGPLKTNEWRVAPRFILRKSLSEHADIGIGLDQEFQVFRLDQSLAEIDADAVEDFALFLSERLVSVTGIWTDLRWRRGIIELRPGVRVDTYVQVGASPVLPSARAMTHAIGVDPRMLARETLNERWALKQSLGIYHQPPSTPIPIPGIESLGFENGLQRNIQASFGYEYRIGRFATLSQETYIGRLSNLQDYEFAQTSTNTPNELEDFIVRVTGWAYGLETMFKLDPRARVYGWIAYTLSRSTRDFTIGGRVVSPWDQRHILNLVVGYKLGPKWRVGGRVHFNTGRPYTGQEPGQTLAEALEENRNNRRLPYFFELDARIERVFVYDTWRLHMFLDLTNATMSREIFACGGQAGVAGFGGEDEEANGMQQSPELAGCVNPQGIRYVLPSVGMRGVF